MKTLLLLLYGLPLVANSQTIYRCAGPGGQSVFQQAPCAAGKGGPVEVRAANIVEGNPAGEAPLRAQAQRSLNVSMAQARGQIIQGMTAAEMQVVMGGAQVVNTDHLGGRVREQHVYRGPAGARYVYTENGIVTGVQDRPSIPTPKRPNCVAKAEVEDIQSKLKSVTRTPEELAALRQRLAAADSNRCD